MSLLGASLSFVLYNFQSRILFSLKTSFLGRKIYTFLNKKWFFDKIYNEFIGQFFFKFGYSISYKCIDRGIFEIAGPTGISYAASKTAVQLHIFQSNSIDHYTLIILAGIAFFLCFNQLIALFGFNLDYRLFSLIFVSIFFIEGVKK